MYRIQQSNLYLRFLLRKFVDKILVIFVHIVFVRFVDIVSVTFVDILFVTFVDTLLVTFTILLYTITELSIIVFKYLPFSQIHVPGFQL